MDIADKVMAIVAEQLEVKPSLVKPDSAFIADLGADSLDTVELIMAIEDEFKFEVSDDEAEDITTVQTLIDYVVKRVQ